jgi:hypothetical protein
MTTKTGTEPRKKLNALERAIAAICLTIILALLTPGLPSQTAGERQHGIGVGPAFTFQPAAVEYASRFPHASLAATEPLPFGSAAVMEASIEVVNGSFTFQANQTETE